MNQLDLNGRIGVVTGGARGIGFAIAQRFLASGASVCIWDVDEARMASAVFSLGGGARVHSIKVDIGDAVAIQAAAAATKARFGRIDLLVNNAAIAGVTKKMWECTVAEWRHVIDLNLMGVFHCCHAVVPLMLESGYGRIVSIASIAGKEGNPNASHYSAAKAAVIGLTKSLGKELAKFNILVNCVAPAVIQTEILEQVSQEHIDYMLARIPMGRPGKAEEVAALVAWLCSGDCSFSTGAVYDISGGRATY